MPATFVYLVHQGWAPDGEDRDITEDRGPLEAAYLTAVRDLADEAGVRDLTIRDPQVAAFVTFGLTAPIEGHGLDGLFPRDLTGFHDGASIPVDGAVQLVRAMLRDHGAWCRLEAEDRLFVHVGDDQRMYLGSDRPSGRTVRSARAAGLVVEPVERSPYDPVFDDLDAPFGRRTADDAFWAEVTLLVEERGELLLDEVPAQNAHRWRRLRTADDVRAARTTIAPRAQLLVWPDLWEGVPAVLGRLVDDFLVQLLRLDADGSITCWVVDDAQRDAIPELLAGASAACAVSCLEEDRRPLTAAVLPDPDGIVRARWAPR